MFCGNCGQKIEDGAKFCPFCGSQIQIPEEIKSAESAAPVEAPAEPAAFVQSAAPVETPAEPAAFVQPTAPVEAPAEPAAFVQPAAPVEAPAEPAAFVQPAAPVKPKKKGKAGLVIGVSAAAVVLGGAAVGFFCFHDDITRMVMGEKEYTKMVNRNAFAGIIADDPSVQKYTDVLTTGLGSVVNTANRKSALSSVYNSSEDEPDLSAPRIQPVNLLGSAFDSYDNVFRFISGAPDGVKLSTESSVNIKFGSLLSDLNNESVQKILDTVNSLKFRTVFANGESDLLSFGISGKNGEIGTAEMYIDKDGVLIAFQGVTDKTIYIDKKELGITEKEEKPAKPKFEDKEALRIYKELLDILFDGYDSAAITFTENVTLSGVASISDNSISATATGTEVKAVFTYDQICAIMDKVGEKLAGDPYLISYVKEAYGISEEDYKKIFASDSTADQSSKAENPNKNGFSLTIRHIVDVHNNILATGVDITPDNGKGSVSADHVGNKNESVLTVKLDSEKSENKFVLANKATSGTDGFGAAQISSINKNSQNTALNFGIEWTYTGAGKVKFLDKNIHTGKYVIKLTDPDKFFDMIGNFTDNKSIDDDIPVPGIDDIIGMTSAVVQEPASGRKPVIDKKILDEIKKIVITFEQTASENSHAENLEIALGEIGTFGFSSNTVKADESVSMPDKNKALSINDRSGFEELGTDVLKWLRNILIRDFGVSENDNVIKSLDKSILKTQTDGARRLHYSDYSSSSVRMAQNAASDIAFALDHKISEAMNNNEVRDGVLKFYFDNGFCEIIDNAGLSSKISDLGGLGYDSLYAQVFFDKRVNPNGILGVTAVFTDDKNDIPADLPNVFNYVDNVYPWDEEGVINDFAVGTYPQLAKGVPTTKEIIEKPELDVNELNGLAHDVFVETYNALGFTDTAGDMIATSAKSTVLTFYSNIDGYWKYTGISGRYGSAQDDTAESEFIETLERNLNEYVREPDLSALIYFRGDKLVGTAVSSVSFPLNPLDKIPSAEDFASGSFSGWSSEGDGYFDNRGNVGIIGTYAFASAGPLLKPYVPASDSEYSGDWVITSVMGNPIPTGSEDDMTITIDRDILTMSWFSSDPDDKMYVQYGLKFRDKPAAVIVPAPNAEPDAWMLLSDINTARIVDTEGEEIYSLIRKGTSPNRHIPEGSPTDIGTITGLWSSTYDGNTITFAINSGFTMSGYENGSTEAVYSLEARDYGFDIIEMEKQQVIGTIVYLRDLDTLVVTDSSEPDRPVTLEFSRLQKIPLVPYAGNWQLETINGKTPAETVSGTRLGTDDFDIKANIGEFASVIYNQYREVIADTRYPTERGCILEDEDGNMFSLMYDSMTDKLTIIMNNFDTDLIPVTEDNAVIVFTRK